MNIILRKVRGIKGLTALMRAADGPPFGSGAPARSAFAVLASPIAVAFIAIALLAVWTLATGGLSPDALMLAAAPVVTTDLKALHETRRKAIADARSINDKALAEKRELSTEEETQYQAFMAEGRALQKKIDREMELREEERGNAERIEREREPDAPNPESRARTVKREFRSGKGGCITGSREYRIDPSASRETPEYRAGFEASLLWKTDRTKEENRALQMDSDTAGGFTVAPQQFIADLIQAVDNRVFFRGLATVSQLVGAHSIGRPSLDADPADPTWVSELNIGSEDSTMAFGKRELSPHPLAQFIKVSRKLMRHSPIGPSAIVRDRLSYKQSVVQEAAYMTGNGVQKPLGVFTASNDGVSTSRDVSTDNTTTAPTFDGLKNAKWTLKPQYWPRAQWIAHTDFGKLVDKIKDGEGRYIWQESVVVGAPDRLLSFPINYSEYAPNTFTTGLYVAALADFANYWIVESLAMEIQQLNELYAGTNQVGFIIRSELDGMPVLQEAFVRVKLA